MQKWLDGHTARYICYSCANHVVRQSRKASKLSSINRGLFRETSRPSRAGWGNENSKSEHSGWHSDDRRVRDPRRPSDALSQYEQSRPKSNSDLGFSSTGLRKKSSFGPAYGSKDAKVARFGSTGSLPLTTAASTFIYGASSALACLKSGRRKVYRAYVEDNPSLDATRRSSLMALLARQSIRTLKVDSRETAEAMSRASSGRPHQGIVLEVSQIPFPPVEYMYEHQRDGDVPYRAFKIGPQQAEEAEINNRLDPMTTPRKHWRKPLVLLLDGVKDEGNMGNIIRTAYFYGVDYVAICVNTCAPITSPIVAKAASGALEAVSLLRLDKPTDFLRACQTRDWKVWASVPPGTELPARRSPAPGGNGEKPLSPPVRLGTSYMQTPLHESPCILMLGAEGEGLRSIMLNRANGLVSIDPPQVQGRPDLGIDSINVASAAAVLMDAFMRQPVYLA